MMLDVWASEPLSNFISLRTYGFTNPMPTTDRGPYMVTAKDIREGKIDYESARHTSAEAFIDQLTDKSRPRIGDVLLTKDGSIGRVAVCDRENICINQSVALLRPNGRILPKFLSYLLQAPVYQRRMESDSDGSTIKHIYITRVDKMPVSVPNLTEQQAIATLLGALDDKIAANTILANTAMRVMHASFQQLIAEGDSSESLVEDVVRRLKIPRKFAKSEILPEGEFPVYDQSDAGFLGYLSGDGYFDASEDHPILYFGDHTCKLRISSERFVVGPNTIPFVAHDVSTLVLYCALQGVQKHEEYKRHWNSLMKKSVRLPSHMAAQDFTAKFKGFFSWRHNLQSENFTLAATRDALLPHLMSGKLRIKDAEALSEKLV